MQLQFITPPTIDNPCLPARFWEKVRILDNECWEWIGGRTGKGYGSFWDRENNIGIVAHRFAYELCVGPIPKELQIDHLCRNKSCVNPNHLETVTNQENIRRGDLTNCGAHNSNKTHCAQGHPFNKANTYRRTDNNGRGCRTCKNAIQRRYRNALKSTEHH